MKLFAAFNPDYTALIVAFEDVTGSTFKPGQFVDRPGIEDVSSSASMERSSVDHMVEIKFFGNFTVSLTLLCDQTLRDGLDLTCS